MITSFIYSLFENNLWKKSINELTDRPHFFWM
uniref:Uncharacterized protein n=1 Tax=Siphoviridae sp. ctCIv11 TaxID=2827806 RepID=A0A8S5S253_9CAUD|nr:MAG TPA: hypothetical protein [Siphoviridae sp. ctCIv11]